MTARGGGDQCGCVPRQAQVVAPERYEVAGDTNDNPDEPQAHALAVVAFRRIFGTYDRGKQRDHRFRVTGRIRCRITISRGSNIDNDRRPLNSAALRGARDSAPAQRQAIVARVTPSARQDRYKPTSPTPPPHR